MKRTISFMTGKGSVNHNSRKFHAKNTDPERSCLNVEYCNENVKDVYHELFDEALAWYNEKQTRSDRRIDDYYEKIRSGKQEKPFHEIILQIGDKDNMGAKTENGQLAAVMLEHGIEWEKKGTHEKHLSVLDFEKKEQATTLAEDKKKLLSDNVKLEKQQKKLQQDIEKMVQSKAVMERNIHAYDEDEKWQLPEPAALMSAKAYKDKKAFPLVEKLKETIKALTIKCVQLAEQGKKLKEKITRQEQQISRLTDKVMEQSDIIDRLQEKTADLGRLERYFGREQVQSIVERSKALEWAEKENKRPKRVFDMSR